MTWVDYASFGLFAATGVADGAREAFNADPNVFVEHGMDGKYWRPNGWENNYPGGDYNEGEKPIRPEFLNGFRDANHGLKDISVLTYGTACFAIGLNEGLRIGKGKGKWWHPVVKGAIGQVFRITAENIAYWQLRH